MCVCVCRWEPSGGRQQCKVQHEQALTRLGGKKNPPRQPHKENIGCAVNNTMRWSCNYDVCASRGRISWTRFITGGERTAKGLTGLGNGGPTRRSEMDCQQKRNWIDMFRHVDVKLMTVGGGRRNVDWSLHSRMLRNKKNKTQR